MKTIGLIGGLTWESTLEYYRIINKAVSERLGKLHSAKIIMYSFDFEEIVEPISEGAWDEVTNSMIAAAKQVEGAGADFVLICTNTIHKIADEVAASISIPLLHIVDVTAEEIVSSGLKEVGLLGTKFTMEQDFYKKRLNEKYDLGVVIPNKTDRETVHNIILKELSLGQLKDSSREQIKMIIDRLSDSGAQGIILGCTELPLLIKQQDSPIPIFDTTTIHSKAAVDYALKDQGDFNA
ncbi:MAG: aspartate/glutamate racemase family protein [Chloroflexota bacterium]|nr:aspartate/glutamate racemase family protein [Chloroflexota bacterium]